MGRKYQVISGDSHMEIPPMAWENYIPKRYFDRRPRLVHDAEGVEGLIIEGSRMLYSSLNLTGAHSWRAKGDSFFNPDLTAALGAGTGDQRLREQDMDGVDAEILFPPIMVREFIENLHEEKVYLSMVQAYNTWLAEEFCAVAPDRLIGCAMIPVSGIEDALMELRRVKKLGLRAVTLKAWPNGGDLADPKVDDRFWELALELDMKLACHVYLGAATEPSPVPAKYKSQDVPGITFVDLTSWFISIKGGQQAFAAPNWPIAQLIGHGTLDRFPELQIYFGEVFMWWLPHTLAAVDDTYHRNGLYYGRRLKKHPSEYWREHFKFGFIREASGIKWEATPVNNVIWGTDFPHSVSSFPETRIWREIMFRDLPDDVARKVTLTNSAKFFGLDLDADITPTPEGPNTLPPWAHYKKELLAAAEE